MTRKLSKGRQQVRAGLIPEQILGLVHRVEKREREEIERAALAKHRTRLNRQLQALLSDQAKSWSGEMLTMLLTNNSGVRKRKGLYKKQ